jgi:site-specific DNA-methyltransferase (adenine-specific)
MLYGHYAGNNKSFPDFVQKGEEMEINKCYNENCLDTMERMPNGFIDLTVTSPPYDNLRTYNGYSFDFEAVAKELFRVTKQGGVVVWVVGDATIKGSETGTSFKQALYFKEIGFNLHDTMVWIKPDPIPLTHNRYEQSFEYMFILSKGKPKTFNPIKVKTKYGGRIENMKNWSNKDKNQALRIRDEDLVRKEYRIDYNNWKISVNDGVKVKHPAKFPEELCERHILSWSNEGDLVYDPFMGSGTTAKMAIINKRNWIGSEISEEYCKIIERRIDSIR